MTDWNGVPPEPFRTATAPTAHYLQNKHTRNIVRAHYFSSWSSWKTENHRSLLIDEVASYYEYLGPAVSADEYTEIAAIVRKRAIEAIQKRRDEAASRGVAAYVLASYDNAARAVEGS